MVCSDEWLVHRGNEAHHGSTTQPSRGSINFKCWTAWDWLWRKTHFHEQYTHRMLCFKKNLGTLNCKSFSRGNSYFPFTWLFYKLKNEMSIAVKWFGNTINLTTIISFENWPSSIRLYGWEVYKEEKTNNERPAGHKYTKQFITCLVSLNISYERVLASILVSTLWFKCLNGAGSHYCRL
jgi:hypothetical protein